MSTETCSADQTFDIPHEKRHCKKKTKTARESNKWQWPHSDLFLE